LLVGTVAVLVHQPLSRVPENGMKFVVGALLTTFGLFWGGEGLGVAWPGADAAILMVLGFVLVTASAFVFALRRARTEVTAAVRVAGGPAVD
ncbi:MAG: hypothetical protein KGJ98_14100, partial [Chloroflexota bacterium]|nr:hypothetical protein [Chloroflexota bacterium]